MGEKARRMAEKVPACGSRTLWIGLSVGCGIVAIIMFIVAGAMGGCECANHSCASPYEFNDGQSCSQTGAGCDAKLCTGSGGSYDGDPGVETGGSQWAHSLSRLHLVLRCWSARLSSRAA